MPIAKEKLIDMHRTMVRIRTFEERVSKEFAAGNLPGIVHLCLGEEASATGACANLRTDDYITSNHRGHGHVIAKGGKTDRMMAELYGKKTGYCKGKGGCMHIADLDIGIIGANGIVGAGITVAGGAALSAQMRGTDQVSVCFFGDGASNTASFYEGVNMASHWKLPVVYVIENNQYAMSTRTKDVRNVENINDRAVAFGIPGITIDGNDVLAVYEAVGEAVAQARSGEGPSLVECKTWRWHGHTEGDPQLYKSKEESEEWIIKRDPIPRFRKKLAEMDVLAEKEADEINREMLDELDKAVKFAAESPLPAPEDTLTDIFA